MTAAVAGCTDDDGEQGEDAQGGEELATEEWSWPNGDLHNTRQVGGPIDSSSVEGLSEAWSVEVEGTGNYGGYTATPIIRDGVLYTQDMASNVYAIDLESGEQLWTKMYDAPSTGPTGITVADGHVYGATPTHAFALSADTGDQVWMKDLEVNQFEGIDMAPGYHDGKVYVSTVPGNADTFYGGNGQGVLWALDAGTGQTMWKWDTVPEDLWGNKEVNSGGGLWYPPAFDEEGDLYVSVANPAPWPGTQEHPWATSRPGRNLYSNSLVKLDGDTGQVDWYNEALPHDLYDWDLHLSPVLTEVDGEDVVLTAGKMGYVYAVDRDNGELLWKKQVGQHNGRDKDNELALEGRHDELPELPVRVYPGTLGGVETQLATNGSTVFAPINNQWTEYKRQLRTTRGDSGAYESQDLNEATGEMVALDVATGEVEWQHDFESPAFGAATVVNDLVFTTTFDGTLWALDVESGEVAWEADLPSSANAPVAVAGNMLLTGTFSEIVAYQLDEGDG